MISVQQALKIIELNSKTILYETISLVYSIGYCLNQDIKSLIYMPLFNQSAMDGYALNYNANNSSYKIIAEIKAGSACKIFL